MNSWGSIDLTALVGRIAADSPTEATLQSEIHTILLTADLNLDEEDVVNTTLESQTGPQRRIDIEIGHACIEVKKRLRPGKALQDAVEQLGGYVAERTESLGQRYVGILTDGSIWQLYQLIDRTMTMVASITVDPNDPDADGLLEWLAAVLATEERVRPRQPRSGNAWGHRARGTSSIKPNSKRSTRPTGEAGGGDQARAWAKLLTTALGTQFHTDDHELFVNHTLLVAMAETIAHAVLGFDVTDLDAATLMEETCFLDAP